MHELSSLVRMHLTEHGLSQRELATAAGVSQATISRVLRGKPLGSGAARERLAAYVGSQITLSSLERVFAVVRETWDGSEAHAEALIGLVLASRELWPGMKEG